MECKGCKKEVVKLAAKGLCGPCYKKELARRSKDTCQGCGHKKAIHAKGLCSSCYVRLQRYGTTTPRARPKKGEHLCLNCNRDPIHAKGLCKVCYGKEHRRKSKDGICEKCGSEGKLIAKQLCATCYKEYIEEKKKAVCIGCDELKPIKAMGMCHKCYQRYLRHDDPTKGRVKKGDEPCSHCGARPVHAQHLCANCYARYLARGTPERIKVKAVGVCKECGKEAQLHAKSLCLTCYARHGRIARFGLPEDWYQETLKKQGGVCVICGKENIQKNGKYSGRVKKMHIDHDHETGAVRGLLCQMCNQGLGCFKDSTDLLTNAIDYLKKHASSEA
jgi:hypothetical protein